MPPLETVITRRVFLGKVCLDPIYISLERFGGEELGGILGANSEKDAYPLKTKDLERRGWDLNPRYG